MSHPIPPDQEDRARRRQELVERLRREEREALEKEMLTDSDLSSLKILSSELKKEMGGVNPVGMRIRAERRHVDRYGNGGAGNGDGRDGLDGPVLEIKKIHIGLVAVLQLAGWVIGYLISVNALQLEVTAMKKDIERQQSSNTLVIDKLSRMETDIKWIIQEQGRLSEVRGGR